MNYHVVHSLDPYLLARLCTELQMGKYINDTVWNEGHNPFEGCLYMSVDHPEEKQRNLISFYSMPCLSGHPINHTLTSRNYLTVLTAITNETI